MQTTTSCATWCSTRPGAKFTTETDSFLVQSKEAYDLMATPREVRPFDTALMSRILGVPVEQIRKELDQGVQFLAPQGFGASFKQLPKEAKVRLDEHAISPDSSPSTGPSGRTRLRWRATCWDTSAKWTTGSWNATRTTAAATTSGAAASNRPTKKCCAEKKE